MKYNAKIVDSAKSQPENFLKIWDKLYPDSRSNGMNKQLWSALASEFGISEYHNCNCDEIGYLAWNNNNHSFKFNINKGIGKYREFGYRLEYYTTPTNCFDFWLDNDILWNGHYLKNLNELSQISFHKNVDSLNQSEIIQLIAFRKLGFFRAKDTFIFKETVNNLTLKLAAN